MHLTLRSLKAQIPLPEAIDQSLVHLLPDLQNLLNFLCQISFRKDSLNPQQLPHCQAVAGFLDLADSLLADRLTVLEVLPGLIQTVLAALVPALMTRASNQYLVAEMSPFPTH